MLHTKFQAAEPREEDFGVCFTCEPVLTGLRKHCIYTELFRLGPAMYMFTDFCKQDSPTGPVSPIPVQSGRFGTISWMSHFGPILKMGHFCLILGV